MGISENRHPFPFICVHSKMKDNMIACITIIQGGMLSSKNSNSRIYNLKKSLDKWSTTYVMGK